MTDAAKRACRRRREAALALAQEDSSFFEALHVAMFGGVYTVSPAGVMSTPPPSRTLTILAGHSILPPKVDAVIASKFPPHPDEIKGYPGHYRGWQARPVPHPDRRFLRSPKESVRPLLDEFFRRHPKADLSDDTRREQVSYPQPLSTGFVLNP